jgi:hypothetical protein
MPRPSTIREFAYIGSVVDVMINPIPYRVVPITGEVMTLQEVYNYLTIKIGQHKDLEKCLSYYKTEAKQIE